MPSKLHALRPSLRPVLRIGSVLVLLGAAAATQAQSLPELLQAARGYDATYLAARSQFEAAQHRAEQSRALRRPTVGVQISSSRAESDTPYTSPLNTSSRANNATLSASQPLFNRANDKTLQQAEKSLAVAQADLDGAEQDLVVRVAQAYFDVLASMDSLTTAQAAKTAIAEQLAAAKRAFEVGTATITDTREAQARFDLATAQEIAVGNELRTRRAALDQLVGRSGVMPHALKTPAALPQLEPSDADAWVGRAEGSNPLVRKARTGLEIAQLETEKAKAGHLPTVTLSGTYGNTQLRTSGDLRAAGGGSFTVAPFFQQGTSTNANVAVTLQMPLYAGHAIENRVKETVSLEEKSRNDLDAARRSVTLATRQAYLGVQSLGAQVAALEAAEVSSKLALEATQLGYKVGVRVNLDVLNAQTQLFQTQRDLSKARYDTLLAGLRLRQAAGVLSSGDVNSLAPLLAPR